MKERVLNYFHRTLVTGLAGISIAGLVFVGGGISDIVARRRFQRQQAQKLITADAETPPSVK
jgi:hypothetical protein